MEYIYDIFIMLLACTNDNNLPVIGICHCLICRVKPHSIVRVWMKAETNAHNVHDSRPFESIICQKYFQCMFIYQAEIIFHNIHDVCCFLLRGVGPGYSRDGKLWNPPLPTSEKQQNFFIVLSVCTVEYGLCGEHCLSGWMLDLRLRGCRF